MDTGLRLLNQVFHRLRKKNLRRLHFAIMRGKKNHFQHGESCRTLSANPRQDGHIS